MKKAGNFLLIIICLTFPPLAAEARPRMAVRAFEDRTEEGKAPAGAVMDMMVTELNKAGIFDLMERERLDYIADEIRLGQSGLMDPETAPEMGKIKGVQYTMTGAITLYYYNEKGRSEFLAKLIGPVSDKTAYVLLEIRIISNNTGQIVYTADELGTARRVHQEFAYGGYGKTTDGILGSATREAVLKHVARMRQRRWE